MVCVSIFLFFFICNFVNSFFFKLFFSGGFGRLAGEYFWKKNWKCSFFLFILIFGLFGSEVAFKAEMTNN